MNAHESKYTLVVHPKELGSYAEHLQHFCFNPGLSPKRDLQNYQEDCRKSVFLDVGMKSYLYWDLLTTAWKDKFSTKNAF